MAKSLTKPSIDLDPKAKGKDNVDQTQPSFPSIEELEGNLFEESELPDFEAMLKQLPERAHLMPEDPPALPDRFDWQEDGFGEDNQIIGGPSIFDDDFEINPTTGAVSEATRVTLNPDQGARAQMETFMDDNKEGADEPPNAPVRASGAPENGVRSQPPPRFSESGLEEPQPEVSTPEKPPDVEPMDDVPEFVAPPQVDNLPEIVLNDDVEMDVAAAPPAPNNERDGNNESGSTGMELLPTNELTGNGNQPPPKRRRRARKSKLRFDKTTQLDKDNMRQGWSGNNDEGELQGTLTNLDYKPAKKLLNENFNWKNKNAKLNAMLRKAATDEKFFEEDDDDEEEEWETLQEEVPEAIPQDLPEVSLAPSVASDIRGSDVRGKRLSTLINSADSSRQSLEPENANVAEMENVPDIEMDFEAQNPLEAIQESANEEAVAIDRSDVEPLNVEPLNDEDQLLPMSQNEARPLFVKKLKENSSNQTMTWNEINQRAGIKTRLEAACLFNALLHGIAEKKYDADQDGYFAPIEVKKL